MKRTLFISVSIACLLSCSIEKKAAVKENVLEPCPQTITTSVGSDWEYEQLVMMRS